MDKAKYFFKNTFILLLGKISTQFLSFLLLPLYTSYLTANEYGIADLITTYVVFVAPLLCLQVEAACFRFLINYRNDDVKTNKLIKCILYFILEIIMFISIILFLINWIFKIKYFYYIYIYGVLFVLYSFNQQISRGKGNNTEYAISSCLYGIIIILCNILFIVVFKQGVIGLLLSYIIASGASLIYLMYKNRIISIIFNSIITKNDKKLLNDCLDYSVPLIPSSISWWILSVSDRTILSIFIDAAANGIYAISNKFSSIYIGLFNIVSLSWTESVSLHIESKDSFLEELYNLIIKIFVIIMILMIGFIPIVYPILIGNEFINSYKYVPILLTGSLFNVCFGLTQGIYTGLKKTRTLAKTAVMCAILNLTIDLVLVKYIGIYAAAISTCIAYFALCLYQYVDINKYFSIKLKISDKIYLLLIYFIGIYLYYLKNIYLSLFFIIISSSVILVFNINKIKKIIILFQKK